MAYIPSSGSVVAFQSDPSKLQASITGTVTVRNPQSVSGTVQADIRGSVATVIIGGSIAASFTPPANQSVSGTVQSELLSTNASVITVGSPVANQSVSGTVNVGNFPAIQVVAPNNSSLYSLQPAGSILAVSGSFTPPANQSVSGTVGASVIGLVPIRITDSSNASVITVGTPVANQSVSGTVGAAQIGAWTHSVVGSVTVYQGAVPWAMAGSVASFQAGTQTTYPRQNCG